MKKKIKIRDVAQEAGVSVSAVSAVLSSREGSSIRVSPERKEKIRRAARKLGYVPDPAAQNLVSGISNILSVFSYEPAFPFAAESEFYEFLLGIEKEAEESGFDILLLTKKPGEKAEDQGQGINLNRLKLGDGGILIGIKRHTEILLRLMDDGFPLVFIGRRDLNGREVSMVGFDYYSIIEKLVNLVWDYGHRNFLYLCYEVKEEPYQDRLKALEELCGGRCGASLKISSQGVDEEILRAALKEGTTLFFVERKEIALQLEDLCRKEGLVPGRDISAVLLEDQWFNSSLNWTCWSSERVKLGMEAVSILKELIQGIGETPVVRLISPEVHKGDTLLRV